MLAVTIREEFPHASFRGEETGLTSEATSHAWGFYQSLNDWGKGCPQLQPPPALLSHLMNVGVREMTTDKITAWRYI